MFKDIHRLFASPARIKLLKYFISQPHVRATSHDVASTIGVPQNEVDKGLRSLVHIGVLSSRKQARGNTFMLNRSHELVPPLTAFLEATTKPSERTLTDLFRKTRGVVGVVATGGLVNEPRSSLDLLIITRSKKRYDQGIAQVIKKAEHLVASPLTYAVLEAREYEERLEARDRLLRDVFEFKHAVLIGKHRFDGTTS